MTVAVVFCRGREDRAQQPADRAVASVQEETEQAGVPHAVVGSAARHLRQPVPFHLRLQELRLQVSRQPQRTSYGPDIGLPYCTDGSSWMCRNRAFAFLFADGSSEELSSLQVVEAHAFPQHFSEMTRKVGLAPAAIVSTRGSDNSVLKSLDANRLLRPNYPLIGNCFPSSI